MTSMQERTRAGRALRAASPIAESVSVTERIEVQRITIPFGTACVGHREEAICHETTIVCASIGGDDFRSELKRLAAGARDGEIGRRHRRWRPESIEFVLEDAANLLGAPVERPINRDGAVQGVALVLRHDEL
jgi:hypothetical protein